MKKGFTLIELLAVIVILAIIALIATPIILNIINDTKKESLARSAENYLRAVEQTIAKENLKEKFNPTKCTGSTTLTCTMEDETTKTINVKIDGKVPTNATITFENGYVLKDSTTTITFDSKIVTFDENGKTIVVESQEEEPTTYKTYANGDAVYFNVDTGTKCEAANAVSTTETKTGCMKFYAFNDEEGKDTVDLILDHNTTERVEWSSRGIGYLSGPKEVVIQLKTDTDGWQGTITPENYILDQTGQPSNENYTIHYKDEGYKARLITAQEIAKITGADKEKGWDETTATHNERYYFDSRTSTQSETCKSGNTSGCQYGWLYDRTSSSCTTYGCNTNSDIIEVYGSGIEAINGYWTASYCADGYGDRAWLVSAGGSLGTDWTGWSSDYGVRPVITVSKDKLN